MSPELERLLEALYERETCEPKHRDRCERTARRLLEDSLQRVPLASRERFLEALSDRYRQFSAPAANHRRFRPELENA